MSPKKGVGSPKASAGVGAFKRLSEIPGVLEEGKIFFFYRHSHLLVFSPSGGAVRRVHYLGRRASACAMIMSYTFCIMVPLLDNRHVCQTLNPRVPEGRPAVPESCLQRSAGLS